MAQVDDPVRVPNRAARRAQAARSRWETRRLKKLLEQKARKRFEKAQVVLAADEQKAAEEYRIE